MIYTLAQMEHAHTHIQIHTHHTTNLRLQRRYDIRILRVLLRRTGSRHRGVALAELALEGVARHTGAGVDIRGDVAQILKRLHKGLQYAGGLNLGGAVLAARLLWLHVVVCVCVWCLLR